MTSAEFDAVRSRVAKLVRRAEERQHRYESAPLDPPIHPVETIYQPHLLTQQVSKLYASGLLSDCTLVSRDGKEFPAHRAILAAWSPVLASMFSVDMAERASGVCRMENFDGKVMDALLKFVYTCTLSGVGEMVEELLELAEQYDIPPLAAACEQFMAQHVQVSTAPGYLHLAHRRGLDALKSTLAQFIAQHKDEF